MKFKSTLGIAALEELNEAQAVAHLNAANEGWKGAALGFAGGYLGYFVGGVGQIVVGSGLANEVERKKAEIEKIAREIEKAAMDNGKKAVSEGKISSEDFKKEVNVGAKGVIRGAILGTLFGGIYGAIKGSELEDLMGELEAKCKELDNILKKGVQSGEATEKAVKGGTGKGKAAKEDNEGEDDAAAADAAAGAADDTAAATGGEGDAAAVVTDPAVSTDGAADPAATDVAPVVDAAADPAADLAADPAAAGTDGAAATAVDGDTAAADPAAADDAAAASAADTAVAQVEATGDVPEVAGDAVQIDPEAEVVEEQMTEVDQIEEKTADVNEDVEKLEAATESLEGCVAILDAAAQRGGLDIFGASLLRNNVNTVTGSLKVKPLMLPALEDMETPSAKIDGANSAKEQIVAFINRIIEAIKSAFARIGEWLVETYKRLTDAFVAVERRAEKLAEKVKNSTMKEGTLDSKALLAKIAVNGEASPDAVQKAITELTKTAVYLNDPKTYKQYLEALDLCEEMLKNPEKDEEIRGKISAKLAAWSAEMNKHSSGLEGGGGEEVYMNLLGNQHLIVLIPRKAEEIGNMLASVGSTKDKAVPTSVEALAQNSAIALCTTIAQNAKAMRSLAEDNKGGIKELMAEINKRKDTLIAISASNKAAEMEGKGTAIRAVVVFINKLLLVAPKLPVHAINRALPRNMSAALDYVAASVGGAAEAAAA